MHMILDQIAFQYTELLLLFLFVSGCYDSSKYYNKTR